ncbi:hypothetical protein [Saccharothrix sp. NRRL B-16314]|uniref:hypothetical protein n=1 Tax=Saccharothrix sp. NRRL B-16314 TaxID=1463825 RepID=UPI000525C06C|nr:hypothetical protein [Saccharothrix sp. NRRL B-16314]
MAFALDVVTILYSFEHADRVFALAHSDNDTSMNGPVSEGFTYLSWMVSLVVVGVSTLLLGLAVVALLRRRWWGYPLTLVVMVPHAAFTAVALPTVGWRTRSSPSPRDHAPYYDPVVTPLVVQVADVAMIPLGFVGAVSALVLLALPVSRRFQREVERANPG